MNAPWHLVIVALLGFHARGFTDTEFWLGAEYTPAAAPGNGFWWQWYESYEPGVERELTAVARHLKLTSIRVWLMWEVFDANADRLHANMDRFLNIASRNNISVGFVFFGDCFNHAGGSVQSQCTPVKGVHNGCWMSSPQDVHRRNANGTNAYVPLKPFVTETIAKFRGDSRIRWWEIFNEPKRDSWSLGLRHAAYGWAKAMKPMHPVISCWDDSNDTDIVDHHDYGTSFTSWTKALYSDPEKGAVVTEAGSRWYQPDPGPTKSATTNQADQGSPLTVLNYLSALREEKKKGSISYVPGAMICWELMVGNSNTRWHWGTAAGTNEPAIPWDAWMFPDGTPISFTEVAAFRRYVTGHDEFLRFDDFLPNTVANGDRTMALPAGATYLVPPGSANIGLLEDGLFEATVWAGFPGDGNITLVARAAPLSAHGDLQSLHMEESTCSQDSQSVFENIDISGAAYAGIDYRTIDMSVEADAPSACASECCKWSGCGAWVVQSGTGPSKNDGNCKKKTGTCCWLKPDPNGSHVANTKSIAGVVTAKPPRPVLPPPPHPGPASPNNVSGYHVVLTGASNLLALERRDASGSVRTMGVFNISSLENGLVQEAWNMLRVLVVTKDDGVHLSVWFNPMFPETGFVGNSSDADRIPKPMPARLHLIDKVPLPAGEMMLTAGGRGSKLDYVSVLPAAVMLGHASEELMYV